MRRGAGQTFSHVSFEGCVLFLLQGVDAGPEGLKLISEVIRAKLGITMTVLMGANIANEVADEKFCETTIGMELKAWVGKPSRQQNLITLLKETVFI